MIDLRSDTITQPTPAMRRAMADAPVGDDVYGEDPTINLLEIRAAQIFEREAAIFVPTGTMGNQIAIRMHTQPGLEVIVEQRSHILDWEMAMVAAFSGCVPRTVTGNRGVLTWEHIAPAIGQKIYYRAQTALVCLENTHNMAGGTVTPLANLEAIWAGARAAGLSTHLDGARVFNAAAALGTSVPRLTRGFDTVMFCLSKGLGAPVGSMLVGSQTAMEQARIHRKALGGGMRQAGILAAAGLIALEEGPAHLLEDHANARLLAEAIAPYVDIDLTTVQTNIVIFELRRGQPSDLVASMKRLGVACSAIGGRAVRFVTHRDVSRVQCEQATEIAINQIQQMQ